MGQPPKNPMEELMSAKINTLYYYCNDVEPVSPQPGHHQFIVRDPMGLTIELYSSDTHAGD